MNLPSLPNPTTQPHSSATMSTPPPTLKRRRQSYERTQVSEAAKKPYTAPSLYAVNIAAAFARNQIHEIHRAEQLFAQRHVPGKYFECKELCKAIIKKNPSEAVMAKAHTMIAAENMGPGMYEESL